MKTEIIEFNQKEIYCPIDNGQIYVAIRTVCDALGVDANGQKQRLKRDEMWSQLRVLVHATGRDEKRYEMVCLPLQFVFGWIMTIDTNLVKDQAKKQLIAYKIECCQVLYHHFWHGRKAAQKKEQYLTGIQHEIETLKKEKKEIDKTIKNKQAEFEKVAVTPATQLDMFLEQNPTQN